MGDQSKDANKPIDDRSPMAKALSKVSEILAACLLLIIPALIGIWLDRSLSTVMLFTVLGLLFGVTGALLQLKRLVGNTEQASYDPDKIIKYDEEADADRWSEEPDQ